MSLNSRLATCLASHTPHPEPLLREALQLAYKNDDVARSSLAAPGGVLEQVAPLLLSSPGSASHSLFSSFVTPPWRALAWEIVAIAASIVVSREETVERRRRMIDLGYLSLGVQELARFLEGEGDAVVANEAGSFLWNISDMGSEFDGDIASIGREFFGVMVKVLGKFKGARSEESVEGRMLDIGLNCVYNSSRFPLCRERIKADRRILPLLEACLESSIESSAMMAGFAICLITAKDDSGVGHDLKQKGPKIIADATRLLNEAVDGTSQDIIWDPEELCRVLMSLSISDVNKPLLRPAIPVMIKALKARPENAKMVKEIIMTFTYLSFEPSLIKILQDSSGAFRTAVDKCNMDMEDNVHLKSLFNRLNPELLNSEKPRRIRKSVIINQFHSSSAERNESQMLQPRIMISFCGKQKEIALKVQDELVKFGFNVWTEDDDKETNILEMTEKSSSIIEVSDVVILCASNEFKENLRCRQEAERALSLNKHLIILLTDEIKPIGWIGLLIGRKAKFECKEFEKLDITALEKEISDSTLSNGDEMSRVEAPKSEPEVLTPSPVVFKPPEPTIAPPIETTIVKSKPPPSIGLFGKAISFFRRKIRLGR